MADKKLIAICQRHGQTTLNAKKSFRGRLDPPLDAKGLSQAEDAADALKNEGIEVERVISSPLLRAVQTADEIADTYDLEVMQDRGLISWDVGFLGGKNKEDFNEILNYFIKNSKSKIPDGESLDDLEQRTYEFFDKELRDDKLTVFVTHNSNIVCPTARGFIRDSVRRGFEHSGFSVEDDRVLVREKIVRRYTSVADFNLQIRAIVDQILG